MRYLKKSISFVLAMTILFSCHAREIITGTKDEDDKIIFTEKDLAILNEELRRISDGVAVINAEIILTGDVTGSGTTTIVTTFDLTTSSQLAGMLSDETGSGAVVFGTSPVIATPNLILENGNGAAPTTDGRIKYDRTREVLQIGDGTNSRAISTEGAIQFIFDGGGSAIAADSVAWLYMPYTGTLTGWDLTVDTSATITIDVWDDTYANFPPDNADAMPGAGKEPTISAAVKATDTDISDWSDTTITKGEYIKVNIDANDNATWALLVLKVRKE